MNRHITYILLATIVLILCSCATMFNSKKTSLTIITSKPGMFYYLNLLFLYLILISTTILNYRMITTQDTFTYKGETFDREEVTEIEKNIDSPEVKHLNFIYKSKRISIDLNKFSSEESHEILNYFSKLKEEINNNK